jgi:hypothetical protein
MGTCQLTLTDKPFRSDPLVDKIATEICNEIGTAIPSRASRWEFDEM